MAIGFDIVIPDTLLKKITDADTKLKHLGETANDTQTAVNNAFRQMINGDLDAFIRKLQTANAEIANLGNKNATKKNGIAEIGKQASHSVDEINELINAFSKLIEENEKLKQQQLSSRGITIAQEGQLTKKETAVNYKSLINDVNELRNKEMERGRELTRQNKENIANHKIYSEELKRTTNQRIAEERKASAEIKILNKEEIESWKIASNEKIARQKDESRKRIAAQKQTTNEIIAQMQSETRFRIQEANRIAKLTQTPNTINRKDVGQIINVSRNATSINQMQTAIKNLEKAKRDLDTTDKKYDKTIKAINKEIENQKQRLKELGVQMDNYKSKSSNLLNISEQLTRRLALVFSVSQVTGYVKKLASVRGEFELQQKSLAAIIQNKDKANEIFDKVTKLAVQSPFQLKELVTYTKELAAYKIETGKIYDNIKMLADISSGVGVDMSRLILAYGQVASANYLRGTELRQFSEAGINVLGGLSDYFTELYGRVIGVGEVLDMVSKRMVSFADVEEVLRKTTQVGGEFYNMQAIQAQTLQGQISNLRDSIDIMLNDIGKSHEGVLKNSVALIKELIENWRLFASIFQDVGAVIGLISLGNFVNGLMLSGTALEMVASQGRGMIGMAARLKTGLKSLGSVMNKVFSSKGGTIGIAISAIALIVKSIYDWNQAVKAQNQAYEENSMAIANEIKTLTTIGEKYRSYAAAVITAEAAMQKAKDDNNEDEYTKAQNELNIVQREQLAILDQLKREYPNIYENLNSEKITWQELTVEIEKANKAKRVQLALNEGKKASFWGDSEAENISDAQEALTKYRVALQEVQGKLGKAASNIELKVYEGIISEEQKDEALRLLEELNKAIIAGSPISEIQKKEAAFRSFTTTMGLEYDELTKSITGAYKKWQVGLNSVLHQIQNLQSNWANNIDTFKAEWYKLGNTDVATDVGKKNALQYLDSMMKTVESEDEDIKKAFQDWLGKLLSVDFNELIAEREKNNKNNVGGDNNAPKIAWIKAVEDELNAAKKKIPELTDEVTKEILEKTKGTDIDISEGFQFIIPDVNGKDERLLDYNEYVKQFEQQWEKIKKLQEKANTKGQALFSKEAVADINTTAKAYEEAARALGLFKDKSPEDKIPDQIRVLEELHKTYNDLNKTFDETTSKKGAIEKLGNAFKEAFNVDIDKFWEGLKDEDGLQLDFTTEEGIVAAFDKLIKRIPKQKQRVQAELAKAAFVIEYEMQLKKDQDKDLMNDLKDMLDDYEAFKDLGKLGISKEVAKELFDVDAMDLSQIKEVYKQAADQFLGTDMESEYIALLDNITKLEEKEQQERLKTYLKYTRDAISERAKIEFDGMRKMAEVRKTFDEDDPRFGKALESVEKEMKAQLQALDWKEFSSSDTFVSIFNDLENVSTQALTSMIDQLEQYKNEWTDLPIDQMEAVAKQLEKMKKARDINEAVANPFMSGAFTGGRLNAKDISQAQQGMIDADKSILASNQQISNMEYLLEMLYEGQDIKTQTIVSEEELTKLGIDLNNATQDREAILQKVIEKEQKNVNTQNKNKKNAQDTLDLAEKQKAVLEAQSKYLGEGLQMANDLYDAFSGLYEALGGDKDNPVAIFADMGMNMANTVIQTIQLQIQLNIAAQSATGLGLAMNAAMGVIGWIVMAVQLLTTALSAIAKAHDNSLQKQIERDAEAVELLQKRFEKLEEAIDNAMSFGQYQKEFDEAKRNLEEQIRLTEDMIALEEAKKKTDKDAIKGYKDEIEEYNEQLKEMEEKRIEDMGGFGGQDAIKDAAEGFIDALADAYNETGDGLDALKDKWDEYFQNLLKKQMMMKVASKYMGKVLEEINNAISDDILTGEEMEKLKIIRDESSEQLNAIMKQLAEQMSWEGGLGGGSELEGLSESIQGVTEVTAQALEAILNSMRFYVIDNNKQLIDIANTLLSWESPTSPILAELKAQTSYLSSIESLFNSVIDRSGSPAVRIR